MAGVTVDRVTKTFGRVRALRGVQLEVQDGEFLTILGPSGSGKTTLLRLVAGLETPDAGRILIGGQVVCGEDRWVPPQRRGVGMVFQNYALWPHMTAYEHVAFPLEMARVPAAEIAARVREVLALVELTGLEGKRPGAMSGGEQQRVALARALVSRPALLLMDECLSNLDARLREKMAGELRRIQVSLGVTTLYVTHDQHEALALSDRIAILHRGVLQQVGRPGELYRRPRTPLVAASLGPINLLSVGEAARLGLALPPGGNLSNRTILGVRPEQVRLALPDAGSHPRSANGSAGRVSGRITQATFMGDTTHYLVEIGARTLRVRLPTTDSPMARVPVVGDQVRIAVEPQDWIVLDGEAAAVPKHGEPAAVAG